MERNFSYVIEDSEAGLTVGEYLKKRGYSRQVLIQLKQTEQGILRNGIWAYTRDLVEAGDRLDIHLVEEANSEQIEPVPLPFDVVYEDEDLMVVNKPADMPVHPSMNNYGNTLANAVAWYSREKGEAFVYRCINRLDRNTTGLLILAKHTLSAAILYGQMRERKIHRTYLALVKGKIMEAGTIDQPIARKEASVIERCVDPVHGERAVTHYQPLRWGDDWTLVQCILETGRTHQIRVHMSWLGHPLPGDFLYCPGDTSMERQPLHSWKLSFVHPITGKPMEFEQELPEDMKKYMEDHA
jgi:23S rRNA pseudouridine1911/1915/1917 synthase